MIWGKKPSKHTNVYASQRKCLHFQKCINYTSSYARDQHFALLLWCVTHVYREDLSNFS